MLAELTGSAKGSESLWQRHEKRKYAKSGHYIVETPR